MTIEISENREMYLLSIANLIEERCVHPVPLNLLAEKLRVTSVSANEMVRKLSEEGYVRYLPYKGVELLPKGMLVAQNVQRHRHIWKVFLVERLSLPLEDADAFACRLEHITEPHVAEQLYEYLGRPRRSPSGKPIPSREANGDGKTLCPLCDVPLEESVEIARLTVSGSDLALLKKQGLCPGAEVRKVASDSHQDLLVETSGRRLQVGADLAHQILVTRPQARR